MGRYDESRRGIMAWQGSLGEMRAEGSSLMRTGCGCTVPTAVDLAALIAELGPDANLWDIRPRCPVCRQAQHYMAAPAGGSTPFRPLLSPPAVRFKRQSFLKGFGFTRRDMLRIKVLAEAVTLSANPRPLNDLDVPFVVGACPMGQESRSTGQPLGHWAGRSLLWWPMNEPEREVWAARPKGPRKI